MQDAINHLGVKVIWDQSLVSCQLQPDGTSYSGVMS